MLKLERLEKHYLKVQRIVKLLKSMVPGAGIEPAQRIAPRDFKSLASTSSATRACFIPSCFQTSTIETNESLLGIIPEHSKVFI